MQFYVSMHNYSLSIPARPVLLQILLFITISVTEKSIVFKTRLKLQRCI